MNPWRVSFLELCRNVLRLALWACLTVNGLMLGVFSIIFTFFFLRHLWSWCHRVLFSGQW
jgi:hypothetical protein